MLDKIKNSFSSWTKLDYAWLVIANITILALSLYWGDSLLSIVSALSGVTSVVFISKQMTGAYYFGAINAATYAIISYQNNVYGSAVLNACYYLPMQFIGLYLWTQAKKKSASNKIETKVLTDEQRCWLASIAIVVIGVLAFVLNKIGGNVAIIDATTTVLSVIAMYLMAKQYLEQWYLWVIVNIASTAIWAISLYQGTGNYATLLMWIVYVLNSLFGLYNWRKNK